MSDSDTTEAAQAGKELADPETMSDSQQQQTKAAQAINDFADLYPRQTGYCSYTVLSLSDGEPTAYEVNIARPECECGDEEYNNTGDGEVCKHIAAALYQAPQAIEMERWVAKQVSDEMRHVQHKVESMEQTATSLESQLAGVDASSPADTDAQQSSDGGESDASGTGGDSGPDAQEQADKLQQAFDDVIDDMEVKANGGLVWFKTGFDTPDEWPFPGGSETFKVTSEPDMVKYVHDGSPDWADYPHPAHDDKPGEYFKNALEPSDVDAYIGTVLQ